MNKRVKRLWLKALRSGEFTQTQEKLRTETHRNHSYCCLGVLCELHRKEKAPGRRWQVNADGAATYLKHPAGLPAEVAKWAGLKAPQLTEMSTSCWPDESDSANPAFTVRPKPGTATLDELNDTNNLTFTEIADVIESTL